jgi:tetratricopeptide (TPR) repeat protein
MRAGVCALAMPVTRRPWITLLLMLGAVGPPRPTSAQASASDPGSVEGTQTEEADPCAGADRRDLRARVACTYPLGPDDGTIIEDRHVLPAPEHAGANFAAVRVTRRLPRADGTSCRLRQTDTWHRKGDGSWHRFDHAEEVATLVELERQGAYEVLLRRGQDILRTNPICIEAYCRVANALHYLGRDTEAGRMLATALSIDPENTVALLTAVRRAKSVDVALRRWARVPEDACHRASAYFNYALHLHGRDRIRFLEETDEMPEAMATLLISEALAQARDLSELRRFLTPARVLAAYRELRDGGQRPEFRRSWGWRMALVVGHLYGLDLANPWVQTVVDAGPDSEQAEALTRVFASIREQGEDRVSKALLFEIIPAATETP